ncbi:hypothetical protein RHS04_08977 [Rhizoctonia solani]|uniref:Uncharacterized protein n=1 Tax=Rhizoctonia solani TaxID=456999 RepID=A0A8H7H133_9AGAM|nr:hypothetical protein RHS04_08977 [Rhizoctonia solani]
MFTSRSDLLVIVDNNGAVYSLIGLSSSTAVIVDHTAVGICVASAYSPVRPSSSDGVVIDNGGVGAGVVSLVTLLIGPSTSPPPSLTTPACVLFPLAVAVAVAMNVDDVHVAIYPLSPCLPLARDAVVMSEETAQAPSVRSPPPGLRRPGSHYPRRRRNARSVRHRMIREAVSVKPCCNITFLAYHDSPPCAMSLLPNKAYRGKVSSSTRFRVSQSPYPTRTSKGSASRLLLTPSKAEEITGGAFDRRTWTLQQSYQTLIKSHSAARRKEVETVRDEVGWANAFSEGTWEPIGTGGPVNGNAEDDWFDDPEGGLESSWTERLAREEFLWEQARDQVYEAYLAFNQTGAPAPHPPPPLQDKESSKSQSFTLLCINLTSKIRTTFTSDTKTPQIVTLARHGYFAPTPSSPACAIHIDVLKYCVALRRHASSTSIQGIAAAICNVHRTIYTPHIRRWLSAAIDYYLIILWMAEANVDKALLRDHPDWRMANVCPACSYCLKNEPKLKFSMLCSCDGNNSIKRVAASCVVDRRKFKHSYFLDSQYVDQFENEVLRRSKGKTTIGTQALHSTQKPTCEAQDDTGNEDLEHPKGLKNNADSSESASTACEEQWKNARADDNGKKIVVFNETRIFVTLCRHGFVLLVEDMRQLGKLSKYPLAAVNKLCQVFGNNILVGYDIGCTFCGTAERSPLVRPVVRKHNTSFVVGSFHGYAHNRKCQLANHPLNVEGAGLESFEENKQLFLSSNSVACTTQHASGYHWRQLLALHLEGWDFGQHCAIVLAEKKKAFTAAYSTTMAHTTSEHIDAYCKHPLVQNTNKEHAYQRNIEAQVRRLEAQRTAASEQLLVIQKEEWEAAVKRKALEDYHAALRTLESLVIQRIAELEKSNAIGTGYKARVQMSKAIKRREKAVHHALDRYNAAACAVDPPRETLSFDKLPDYAFLAKFDFLKYSEHGTLEAEWCTPTNRRCVELWQRIQRAKEEIV